MRYLKSFESSSYVKSMENSIDGIIKNNYLKSSYKKFTKEELYKIDRIIDEFSYILEDEGYSTQKMDINSVFVQIGFYRYRFPIYQFDPNLDYQQRPDKDTIQKREISNRNLLNSEELEEFIDRISDDLGDDYIVYVDSESIKIHSSVQVVIEKL